MSNCKMHDANRKDWEFKTVPYDFGELGKYELSMSVSRRGMWIEFNKEQEDAIFTVRFKDIKYCPYCGERLAESEGKA